MFPGAHVRIGFSGSREGMSDRQRARFIEVMRSLHPGALYTIDSFHHGDCVGADDEAHHLIMAQTIPVVIHPPTDPRFRAWCEGARQWMDPLPYVERDRRIVDMTDILIAAPRSMTPIMRGNGAGTWATIRWAENRGRNVDDGTLIVLER